MMGRVTPPIVLVTINWLTVRFQRVAPEHVAETTQRRNNCSRIERTRLMPDLMQQLVCATGRSRYETWEGEPW